MVLVHRFYTFGGTFSCSLRAQRINHGLRAHEAEACSSPLAFIHGRGYCNEWGVEGVDLKVKMLRSFVNMVVRAWQRLVAAVRW